MVVVNGHPRLRHQDRVGQGRQPGTIALKLVVACAQRSPPSVPPAAQVLVENKSLGQMVERHHPKVERIRTWLVRTLQQHALRSKRLCVGQQQSSTGNGRIILWCM